MADDDKTKEELQKLEEDKAKLQAKLEKAQADAAASKRIAAKYDGMSPEEVQEALDAKKKYGSLSDEELTQFQEFQSKLQSEEEKRLYNEGGLSALVDRQTKKLSEQHQGELQALREENERLRAERDEAVSTLRRSQSRIQIDSALSGNDRVIEGMQEFVEFKMETYIRYDDEGRMSLVDPADDLPMVSPRDASKPMSVAEFVEHVLPKIAPSVMKQSTGTGGRGSGDRDTRDNPFLDKKRIMEQGRIRNENPQLAKRLADAARAAGKGKQIAISGV